MKKLTIWTMAIVALAVISFSGAYLANELTRAVTLSNMGDIWSFLYLKEDSPYAEFAEVDSVDFVGPPYPVRGDVLVEIDGTPPTTENYFSIFNTDTPAGVEMQVKFLHEYELYSNTVVTRSIPLHLQFQLWTLIILRTLIVVGLILVGFWGFVRKPHSSPVRSLTLFCYALALQMCVSGSAIAETYATFHIPVRLVLIAAGLSTFTPALWLKLHMLFPRRKQFYRKHRLFLNIALFLPGLVFGTILSLTGNSSILPTTIYSTVFLALGYVLLVRSYMRAENFLERRQTRLVLWGSAPGITVLILFAWLVLIFPGVLMGFTVYTRLFIINIMYFLMLLIPVSLAYAFGRYKLLEVEGRLKRGTRFLAVTLALLLLFVGLIYVFGNLIIRNIGIESQTPTLILGILLALAFMPTQRLVRGKVEEHFYPERARLRHLLRDFLASSTVRTESGEFWKELEEKLADGLSAEHIYPVLRMGDSGSFAVEWEDPAPFESEDAIIRRLADSEDPIVFDELTASGKVTLTRQQEEWFLSRKSAILVPLITNSGLVGFLVISSKTNGEDFTSEELDLLGNLSTQTALVAENLELLGEKLEMKKLEEQMSVARNIQKGLLPNRMPDIPGLEVEALIRFCLEVAGDYYDIIPLKDGRIVLSIGDVAGKGVGPALLMANLQASLRTTQAMGASLAESAEKINRLVFENTPSYMFITFFMVLIDPVRKIIRYVNAGHNPPFLVSTGGRMQMLTEGGLLFGVVENATYREGVLPLRAGEILLMYTDGVCEAMNCDEEEYGEKRITELVMGNREVSLADLLAMIEEDVCGFHGSRNYADDFTLLAARLK